MNRLKNIRKCEILINEKIAEIERLRALATKVNECSEGDRVQSSGSGDKLGDTVSQIVDLQNELKEDIRNFMNVKKECMSLIDKLDNPLLVQLAYKRYFNYETFEQIAEEMDLSVRWVLKLNKKLMHSSF